eukprot:TRINITY_DN35032_c0_g1_i1.p1 TRINITY_DN35032_c0_g1~~TRINITY_DN35032_c0_g1_i1.p1  ORF type:complete len:194 (+),score=17.93 TRINITY_DN35032_c0_g1_i1:100-681(+)
MADAQSRSTLAGASFSQLLESISQSKLQSKSESGTGSKIEHRAIPEGRPQSCGSRASSCDSREPGFAKANRPPSRPSSCSARASSGPSLASPFLRHMPQDKSFSPRMHLGSKVVGNGSLWDAERLLQPERAYPCISAGAAELHDQNPGRVSRPPWKPTVANRRSGWGDMVGSSFPMPPRPISARRAPHHLGGA